jgi:hypothetical protein
MTKTTQISMLLAAIIGFSGAAYASGASESTESPLRAGEASTMTNGVPNLQTTNSPYGDRINQGGRVANSELTATETSDTPMRAGEASTMTNGVPNVATNNQRFGISQASMTITNSTAMGANPVHIPTIEVQAP